MEIGIKQQKLLLLSLLSFSLLSCGGTGISVVEGGMSGTGITMGRITQFGSIYVNGVRFNVEKASFTRDGKISTGQSEFSLGEYIMIKGSFDVNGAAGTATEVSFKDILEGAVTQVSSDNVMIEVLGQSVKTTKLTTLLGFSALNTLGAGNIVEVSGYKDAEGLINATSIKLKQANFVSGVSENELKGVVGEVNAANKSLMIGNIIVDYSSATLEGFNGAGPQKGQLVEAKSDSEIIGNTLKATKIELEDENQGVSTNINLEVEGIVTRFVTLLDFDVNGITVTTDSKTKYENGKSVDIHLNTILEVEGKVNALGVLLAEKVEFEGNESEDSSQDDSDDGSKENDESSEDNDDENVESEDSEDEDSDDGKQNSSEGDDEIGETSEENDGGEEDNDSNENENEESSEESNENEDSLEDENNSEDDESSEEDSTNDESSEDEEEDDEVEDEDEDDDDEEVEDEDEEDDEVEEDEDETSNTES